MSEQTSKKREKEDKKKAASVKKDAATTGLRAVGGGFAARLGQIKDIFRDEDEGGEEVTDQEAALVKDFQLLAKKVRIEAYVIMTLLILIIFLFPVLKPIYKYRTIAPDKTGQSLASLSMPNMTDQAVLSWAATSISEILTLGFGDFDQRVLSQRPLFTEEGWKSFLMAIRDLNMQEDFKLRQLVLTSVPSDAPVITAKGEDIDGDYKWIIEMPVIMTYTTNNNVTDKRRGIVQLTIVRVPPKQNKQGVGIKGWSLS